MGCVQRRPVRVVLGIVMSLAVAYPALGAGEGPAAGAAAPPPRGMNGLNLLHFEDFEKYPGVIAKQWKPTDPKAWAVVEAAGNLTFGDLVATHGVRELTRLLATSPDWILSVLPIRDGLAVAFKK